MSPAERLLSLRLHQADGRRSPHKPLLALLAMGRLRETGSSELPWSVAQERLSALIAEFGPASRTGRSQSAAYPFTRMRADGVWQLSKDVPDDLVRPLAEVSGRFDPQVEAQLVAEPALVARIARTLVLSHFPESLAAEVLIATGLDPGSVIGLATDTLVRRRSATWREAVISAWDRQCAFCGFDGQIGGATVGLDAAHVRWFAYDGPDVDDNGLALCSLHHKLFDRGVLGLGASLTIVVSTAYSARTDSGRAVYDLHGKALRPRPGTTLPRAEHVAWHTREVFKGLALTA